MIDSPPIVLPGRLSHYPKVIEKFSLFYRGIINKKYKYIWRSDGERALFDRDSKEIDENNLIDSSELQASLLHQEMIDYYKSIYEKFDINQYPINIGSTAASMMTSPRIKKELKKLGYL